MPEHGPKLWIASYMTKNEKGEVVILEYHFSARNYVSASIKFWAWAAFKGVVGLITIREDESTTIHPN